MDKILTAITSCWGFSQATVGLLMLGPFMNPVRPVKRVPSDKEKERHKV
jgi:hypothetical protein